MSAVTTIDDLIDALENVRAKRGGKCPVFLYDYGDSSLGGDICVLDDVTPVRDARGEPDFWKDGEWICIVGATFEAPKFVAYPGYDGWYAHQLEKDEED